MKKFIVVIKQHGEGCDYMIACAQKTVEIDAESIEQAGERFISMMRYFDDDDVDWTKDYGGYYGEQALESAVIYEVVDTKKIDTDGVYAALRAEQRLAVKKISDEKDREEYERLKNKFG
jgi:hypothetical protein